MENVLCNLCGSNKYKPFLVRGDLNLFLEGQFQLVQCKQCGLVYLNPRPSPNEILSYYLNDYDQFNVAVQHEKHILARWGRRYGLEKRGKVILKHKPHGKLLDVGCATGDFLASMQQRTGWQVIGIEPNQQAAQYVREHYKIEVHTDSIEKLSLDDDTFDVVTLWNVIEHLPNPSASLNTINRLLAHDGLLVISTPNLDCPYASLFGKYWIGYELPRHLYVFSLQTLSSLLSKSGFKIIDTLSLYGEYAAVASSIRFWLRAKYNRKRWLNTFEKLLFSYPLRILSAPYFFITTRLLRHCAAPTVLAIKDK